MNSNALRPEEACRDRSFTVPAYGYYHREMRLPKNLPKLGWQEKFSMHDVVRMMVEYEMKLMKTRH